MSKEWFALVRTLATSPKWTHGRPYYRVAAMAMTPVAKEDVKTMAVDRWWRIYYNPSLEGRWTPEEGAAVVIHELEHLLRDHAGRAKGRDPELWNVAADLEINDDLRKEGLPLPKSVLLPKKYGLPPGLLAEEYYALLEASPKLAASLLAQAGGEGAKPLEGRDGSGAGGTPGSWEEAAPGNEKGQGEVPGVGEAQAQVLRRQVAQEIRAAKSRGEVPERLRRWADGILEPQVDWRQELRAAIRRGVELARGKADYSYARRGRQAPPFILPGLVGYAPRVAVVVDTSGSMAGHDLGQALGELREILRTVPRRRGLPVLAVDAAVHKVKEVFRLEDVELEGGGGTDMGVGLKAALALRPRPQVVVVLTDGHTPWPDRPPKGARVIVGLIGEGGKAPSWAHTVRIR